MAVNYVINNAGIALVPRLTAGGKQAIDAVLRAYLEADQAAGAPALRAALLAASLSAEQEQAALVEIESRLEPVVREVLEGKRPDAPAALTALRSRLGL